MMDGDLFAPQSRADQIFSRFQEFHAANPDVWRLFQRFALEILGAGRAHYGTQMVFERIRWHVNVETKGDELKLNNDFAAYYGRMFVAKYPQHAGFFQLRRRKSATRPAYATDVAVFHAGPVGDEHTLLEQLRRMADGNGHA